MGASFKPAPRERFFFFVGATHASPCINNSSPVEEGEACLAPTDAEPPFAAATHASSWGRVSNPRPSRTFLLLRRGDACVALHQQQQSCRRGRGMRGTPKTLAFLGTPTRPYGC